MNAQKLSKLLQENIVNEGVTISNAGKVLTSGLVVGLSPFSEHIIESWRGSRYTRMEMWNWLERLPKSAPAIGMWLNPANETLVLDIVRIFQPTDIKGAVALAKKTNQISIYSLDSQQVLWITHENT